MVPGDFITKVKQVNSQSDLLSMSSFAGPSYLTIRSSVCIILIWDPCICNLYNLCQTRSIHTLQKPHQCALNFTEQITRAHFLLSQPSIRPNPAQVILLWKGPPNFRSNITLYPCDRSGQNHLVRLTTWAGGARPYKPIRDVPFSRVSFFSIHSSTGYEN